MLALTAKPPQTIVGMTTGGTMRCQRTAFLVVFCASSILFAQTAPTKQAEAIVEVAKKAAVHSLNFTQGDLASLTSARPDFTPEGWSEFMNHMNGFLDAKGAPTFSSNFTPSGDAVVITEENGVIHFKVPGTLAQTLNQSRTTYHHAEIDVKAGGKPTKISHLEQIYKAH